MKYFLCHMYTFIHLKHPLEDQLWWVETMDDYWSVAFSEYLFWRHLNCMMEVLRLFTKRSALRITFLPQTRSSDLKSIGNRAYHILASWSFFNACTSSVQIPPDFIYFLSLDANISLLLVSNGCYTTSCRTVKIRNIHNEYQNMVVFSVYQGYNLEKVANEANPY